MTENELDFFLDRINLSEISHSWRDGLGLLSSNDRWHHMYYKAVRSYRESLASGLTRHAAADKALGLDGRYRGDRTQTVSEGLVPPKCSLSSLS